MLWKFRSWSATTPPRVLAPGPVPYSSWASVPLRRFVHNCASIRTTRSNNGRRTAITARPYRACGALRWCGPFHLSARESSHDLRMACLTVVPRTDLCSIVSPLAQLLTLSGQSGCRHSLDFPKRRPRTCKRATLAASSGLWPYLSMFAPGVEQKRVSHSCRLHVGPGCVQPCLHVRTSHEILVGPERTSGHGDTISGSRGTVPLEQDDRSPALGSPRGDCERLPHLPATANSQGRLQCNGPGIQVQASISKRNSQSQVRNVQYQVFAQSGCSDTRWMTSAPRGMPTR